METSYPDLKKIVLDVVRESTCQNIKTDTHVENVALLSLINKTKS